MPGHPDWAGTALTHGASKVTTMFPVIAPGATFTQYIQFVKPGYIVNVRPDYTGASGVTPWCRVHWRWADANPIGADLGEQDWIIPVHPSGIAAPVLGGGPVRGPFARLDITNLDAGQPIAFFADIWETTAHLARDDWRDTEINGFQPPAGKIGAPGALPGRNQLASFQTSIIANTTYALPLYSGQAWLEVTMNPVAGGAVGMLIGPQISPGNAYNSGNVTGTVLVNGQAITLTREPHLMFLQAPATGGNFTVQLTAMEYAS